MLGYVRAHTHDIRALTVAVPICNEAAAPQEKVKRIRTKKKPIEFSYYKWAHSRVPMLISTGDDSKLFAYSAKEFTHFSPHDICPTLQRVPIQLVPNTVFNKISLLLAQRSHYLDILSVHIKSSSMIDVSPGPPRGHAKTDLLARVKTKASRKIICSTIFNTGKLFVYSDHVKVNLFKLKNNGVGSSVWSESKRQLPPKLPYAHSMVFSADSSKLLIGGNDRRIQSFQVVDMGSLELVNIFTPRHEEYDELPSPTEPPITKIFTSSDGQWIAAANCFGDVYIFNPETQRQHWFISRLNGASVNAGGFPPQTNNILILLTLSNEVYMFDVEAKQLREWLTRHTFALPRRYQEYTGEVIGLSFMPSSHQPSVIIYSSRSMCLIDFENPVYYEEEKDLANGYATLKKMENGHINGKAKRKLKRNIKQRQNIGKISSLLVSEILFYLLDTLRIILS